MPQINKGGKFIYGLSIVSNDLTVNIPPQAIEEYNITSERRVFLISGSKSTGGFVVTRRELLYNSKIGNILKDNPLLCNYELQSGEMIKYKGRYYCWTEISENGTIFLTDNISKQFEIVQGMKLLSIRSSDIAFTMGAKGPLLNKAKQYQGTIETF